MDISPCWVVPVPLVFKIQAKPDQPFVQAFVQALAVSWLRGKLNLLPPVQKHDSGTHPQVPAPLCTGALEHMSRLGGAGRRDWYPRFLPFTACPPPFQSRWPLFELPFASWEPSGPTEVKADGNPESREPGVQYLSKKAGTKEFAAGEFRPTQVLCVVSKFHSLVPQNRTSKGHSVVSFPESWPHRCQSELEPNKLALASNSLFTTGHCSNPDPSRSPTSLKITLLLPAEPRAGTNLHDGPSTC
jgi:hypothetical protein